MRVIDRTNEIVFIKDLVYGATFKCISEDNFGLYMKIKPCGSGCTEYRYNAISLRDASLCRIDEDEVLLVIDCTLTVE